MSDDKFNDDFLKELEEANINLKDEFSSAKDKKTVPLSETVQQSNNKPPQVNPSEASIFDSDVKSKE
jgi:hypothetical protein